MEISPEKIPSENTITAILHALGRNIGVLTIPQRRQIKELSASRIIELWEKLPEIKSRTDLMRWLKEKLP